MVLHGRWGAAELGERRHARALLRQLAQQTPQAQLGWDLSAVQWLDHVGAQLLWEHWRQQRPAQLRITPVQQQMLDRLLRSLRKELICNVPFYWQESDWPALLAGYQAD